MLSGKSTIIGVLTGGSMDNGRGLARSRVFMHKHESATGRTSCISQHIMGYDVQHTPVYNTSTASSSAAIKTKGWSAVVQGSAHIVTFIDLAGHEKYLKTTIAGLTGCFPDYALIVINSLAGITKMTREHLGVVLALNIPLVVVVTKVDLASDHILGQTKRELFKVLKSGAANKLPVQMRSAKDVEMVIAAEGDKVCPVFFVSCVTGIHIGLLHEYIGRLKTKRVDWLKVASGVSDRASMEVLEQKEGAGASGGDEAGEAGGCEFLIDETFLVTGVGVVVSGTVQRGRMESNSTLLLGPHSDGSFKPVYVRTLHCKRMAVDAVVAGDSCAASLRALAGKITSRARPSDAACCSSTPYSTPLPPRRSMPKCTYCTTRPLSSSAIRLSYTPVWFDRPPLSFAYRTSVPISQLLPHRLPRPSPPRPLSPHPPPRRPRPVCCRVHCAQETRRWCGSASCCVLSSSTSARRSCSARVAPKASVEWCECSGRRRS